MQISINGVSEEIDGEMSLDALIEHKGLDRRFLVVEHNGEAVPRGEFAQRAVRNGDRLEFVRPVAGG